MTPEPYYQSELTRAKLSVPTNIHVYTEKVLEFQGQLDVTDSISPTIVIDSFNGRESQIAINFAYESIGVSANADRLLISLCINETAFTDKNATDEFLNVISLLDVKGFYIIIDRESNTTKAANMDSCVLSNIMHFLYVLSEINRYDVLIGYSDLLSIPLAAVCNADFACGWYSNLKSFSESNYLPTSGGRRPRKRYTSGSLMSAILLVPELHELSRHEIISRILSNSQYNSLIYPSINDTAWTDEVNCLHNWHVISGIINEISSVGSVNSRLEFIVEKISIAESIFEEINSILPQLDPKSNGSHLAIWKEAISLFREENT